MVLSAEEERNFNPSGENVTPLTDCVCSYIETKLLRSAISHIFTSPSCEPEINLFNTCVHFARALIPSECPWKLCMKGLANIFSILLALYALWNSLALEKGWSARGVRMTVEVG